MLRRDHSELPQGVVQLRDLRQLRQQVQVRVLLLRRRLRRVLLRGRHRQVLRLLHQLRQQHVRRVAEAGRGRRGLLGAGARPAELAEGALQQSAELGRGLVRRARAGQVLCQAREQRRGGRAATPGTGRTPPPPTPPTRSPGGAGSTRRRARRCSAAACCTPRRAAAAAEPAGARPRSSCWPR
eukprot:TRINITY_DN10768_c0_g2_i1.p3 TRINITY_DN10768_c0_g2~~TRINITY_DN10768_c0_g2_i1.p3  ORF type:complete len:183 (-),score=7.58 TRINITY_DN10768_c0_g2_i1:586-1134(-)